MGQTIISIACVFEVTTRDNICIETIKIDPRKEFLLNEDGYMEIIKEWDISSATLKCVSYIMCSLPANISTDIIKAKQSDLKKKNKGIASGR